MRKIFFFLAMVVFLIACSEKNKDSNSNTNNNNNNDGSVIVSTEGMGEVKIGMPQEELEKLLNTKIPLTNPTDTSGSYDDSAKIKYRNVELNLAFGRDYYKPDTFRMIVTGVRCNSPMCRTNSGISIGSDLETILPVYEKNTVTIQPGLYNYYETIKTKTERTLIVKSDSTQRVIRFFMKNDKVIGFETTDHIN